RSGWALLHELVLQVPAGTLLEGDTVTLRCRGRWNRPVTEVRFYQDEKDLGGSLNGTELSLSPLQLKHSGSYTCRGLVGTRTSRSAAVTVTVQELFSVPVLEGPPEPTLGSPLTLSCLSTPSPLRPRAPLLYVFYRDGQELGVPQGSPQLLVPAVGVSHSGNYSCQVRSEGGSVRKSSARLRVTVRMPVSNATITLSPLSHQVRAGDPVTLCCSVQVGSAPVTFTWLHNGQEVARGPLLELGAVDVGHSGIYQCMATFELGQDGHQALSPVLALEVTTQEQGTGGSHGVTRGDIGWGSWGIWGGPAGSCRKAGGSVRGFGRVWGLWGLSGFKGWLQVFWGFQGCSRVPGTVGVLMVFRGSEDPTVTPHAFPLQPSGSSKKGELGTLGLNPNFTPTTKPSMPTDIPYPSRVPPEPLTPPETGEVLYSDVVSTKKAGGEYRGDTGGRHPWVSPSIQVLTTGVSLRGLPSHIPSGDLRRAARTPQETVGPQCHL
uniref:Ig-like domain-containing protein n=1 Tax=Serinus canaria TaxID=9135 RepID=A0A8C9NR67_SERCA